MIFHNDKVQSRFWRKASERCNIVLIKKISYRAKFNPLPTMNPLLSPFKIGFPIHLFTSPLWGQPLYLYTFKAASQPGPRSTLTHSARPQEDGPTSARPQGASPTFWGNLSITYSPGIYSSVWLCVSVCMCEKVCEKLDVCVRGCICLCEWVSVWVSFHLSISK